MSKAKHYSGKYKSVTVKDEETNGNEKLKRNNKRIKSIILLFIILILAIYLIINVIMRLKNEEARKKLLNMFKTNNGISENIIEDNEFENEILEEVFEENTEQVNEENVVEDNVFKDSIENYETIGILKIPKLNIEYPIISKNSNAALKISVCKYWGANPNQVGNMVIVGHNYRNSTMLSKLPTMKEGDIIQITDKKNKTINYTVYEMKTIDPYDNECTSQLTGGKIETTIITCVENGKKRFYVKARAE